MIDTVKPPSGLMISRAVIDELMINLYPLPYSTLPATVYHVYLNPRDHAVIDGVIPLIVEQVQRALTGEVERYNARLAQKGARMLNRLLGRTDGPSAIEIPASGWEVYIQPDPDGDLKPGQLGIVSTLSLARAAEYAGTPTTRIVKSVVGGGKRSSTTSHVAVAAAGSAAVEAPAEPPPDSAERARLTYEDEQGPHVFSMRKDSVSVGRGGSSAWVDVQVIASAKVSREHFRIRRDASGRFFIQDVSSWGTSVDGEPVRPAVKSEQGVLQPGPEHELPPRARIGLADALVMQFEASRR
jgi:hypothetical protein